MFHLYGNYSSEDMQVYQAFSTCILNWIVLHNSTERLVQLPASITLETKLFLDATLQPVFSVYWSIGRFVGQTPFFYFLYCTGGYCITAPALLHCQPFLLLPLRMQ